MGFILILATFDGLDVGLLEDVIGEDDCDDDDYDKEMSLVRIGGGGTLGGGDNGGFSGNDLMRRISLQNSFAFDNIGTYAYECRDIRMKRISLRNSLDFDNIGTHAYECRDIRMRRISLRNSLVGNGYMVNLLVKIDRCMNRRFDSSKDMILVFHFTFGDLGMY
ncbi:hypothetical protein Tco_0711780 [Tanacetum coccineum]